MDQQIKDVIHCSNDRWILTQSLNDPYVYIAVIIPPENSVYHGGRFLVEINFKGFPVYPPTVHTVTNIYHPNFRHKENMCTERLYSGWRRTVTVTRLLEYLYSLFTIPDLNDQAICNSDAANMYINDRKHFDKIAREYTKMYAI